MDYLITWFQSEDFTQIGKLVAMSIVQGGPGLPMLHPSIFHYIASNEYVSQVIDDEEVADPDVRSLLQKVIFNLSSV